MTPVPRSWVRALDAAGVVAIAFAIPLRSAVHPVAAVASLGLGALVTLVGPATTQRNARLWGWLLRIAGIALSLSAVIIWLGVSPWLAIPGFAAGMVMVVFGSMIAPSGDTGAHYARFTMESTYDSPGHMVKPPQQNVGDPLEGDDGTFRGR